MTTLGYILALKRMDTLYLPINGCRDPVIAMSSSLSSMHLTGRLCLTHATEQENLKPPNDAHAHTQSDIHENKKMSYLLSL